MLEQMYAYTHKMSSTAAEVREGLRAAVAYRSAQEPRLCCGAVHVGRGGRGGAVHQIQPICREWYRTCKTKDGQSTPPEILSCLVAVR